MTATGLQVANRDKPNGCQVYSLSQASYDGVGWHAAWRHATPTNVTATIETK